MPVIFHLFFVYLLINCILTLYVLTAPEVKAILDDEPAAVSVIFIICMTLGGIFIFMSGSSSKKKDNK